MTRRELAAWLLAAFMLGAATMPRASATDGSLSALVGAIDRNTRASIRTCEAVYIHPRAYSSATVGQRADNHWEMVKRCWR
jgi:hypothetical protein